MAWVMATSVTVHRFLNGDMVSVAPNSEGVKGRYFQFWSYSVITLGFSLFFSGLVGWVGGASESICLVRCGHSGTAAQQPAHSQPRFDDGNYAV